MTEVGGWGRSRDGRLRWEGGADPGTGETELGGWGRSRDWRLRWEGGADPGTGETEVGGGTSEIR